MKKSLILAAVLVATVAPAWAGPLHPAAPTSKLTPAYSILLPGVEVDGTRLSKHPRHVATHASQHARSAHTHGH